MALSMPVMILNMHDGRTSENCRTLRYKFVVSREHQWLYGHLLERFQDDPDVDVVLDRRVAERRIERPAGHPHRERRQAERRRAVAPDDDLRVRSHYIVEL
jgi:hypothetical protein